MDGWRERRERERWTDTYAMYGNSKHFYTRKGFVLLSNSKYAGYPGLVPSMLSSQGVTEEVVAASQTEIQMIIDVIFQ